MGGKGRLRDSWNRSQSDKAARGVSGVHTVQGPQQVTTVFEAGLYALIFSSRKETARKFQRWVFEEVLPSIRATGSYYQHRRPPSPEITAERRVNLVKTGLEIMDRLGGLDERDRMMLRDIHPRWCRRDRKRNTRSNRLGRMARDLRNAVSKGPIS